MYNFRLISLNMNRFLKLEITRKNSAIQQTPRKEDKVGFVTEKESV